MNGNQEIPAAKEVFSTAKQTVALQTRLILGGEALSSNKTNLNKVDPEMLSGIKQETINKIAVASTKERSDYWQGKGTFDQQLKSWCDSMVKYYNNPKFTEEVALKYYYHYFGENKSESNINVYVDEVIAAHTQNELINFDQLYQNLPGIKKLSHIFGGNSSEIIEDLILARAKLADPAKKQELIEQVNEEKTVDGSSTIRLNWLNPDEERRLRWLEPNAKQIAVKIDKPELPSSKPDVPENLTTELAEKNPELFKKSALALLKKEHPLVYAVWEKLVKDGKMSENDLQIDSSTFRSENTAEKIILGTKPLSKDGKHRLIFEDKTMSYEDEIIYKLSHEICHSVNTHIIELNPNSGLNKLANTFFELREKNKGLGITALASQPHYQEKGPEKQAVEDITEFVNMYLQDPKYLKRFLDYLSNPALGEERKKIGLITISSQSAQNAFTVIESIVNEYLQTEQTSPLSIRIIDHSDKPIDSSLIKQIIDQPVIVRVTDLPEKKLIIDLDQTAFDIIGEPSRFLKANLTEKISASKLVPLPSLSTQEEQFFYFTVAKHNDDNTVSYSNCFVANKNRIYQPVGHIDYTTKENDPSKGICHMSNLHNILQSIPIDKLPPHLKTFQSFFSDNIMGVAVEINNQYRSQKLGKALWYFTLAQSEFDGLKEVEIVGDITVYNDPLGQVRSFYQHLGAQPQLYFQYDPKLDKIEGKEKLVASSFLDITQISKIKELLEPIKITVS